jgi:hypothetical protein
MVNRSFLFLLLLALSLLGCQNRNPEVAPNPTASGQAGLPAAIVTTPPPGRATVIGQVHSTRSGQPLVDFPVRLAEVYRNDDQAAFVLDGAFSPGALTDADGRFVFTDIAAHEYVLVIGNPEVDDYVIISEPNGRARVIDIPADQIFDLGEFRVDLGS